MAKRNYERLAIEPFGCQLLTSGDLDPIYIALQKAFYDVGNISTLKRWLVAYWCHYHAGQACYLSQFEGAAFWHELRIATANISPSPIGERWQRGHERRHFRGATAVAAVDKLAARFSRPEELVDVVSGIEPATFVGITERAKSLPLFGPWISFKIADMIDRVMGIQVSGFDQAAVFMFTDPTKAALRLWALKAGLPEEAKPKDQDKAINQVVDYLIDCFKDFKAPPFYDRPVGLQEVETILCKWKSHMNGHYPLFNDIDEINAGVKPWLKISDAAVRFTFAMPART